MQMRTFGITLGLSALGATLIALPGTSAGKQDPSQESTKEQRMTDAQLEKRSRKQAAEIARDVQKIQIQGLVDDEDISVSDDGDVHVLMGSNGGWLGIGVGEVNPDKVKELKLPAAKKVAAAFAKGKAKTKGEALDLIWSRHASLLGTAARARATGGRTAA